MRDGGKARSSLTPAVRAAWGSWADVWRGEAHRTAHAGIVGASPWGMCRSALWSSPRHTSTGNRAARGTAFLARIPRGSQNASAGARIALLTLNSRARLVLNRS
jgi:hypothetical protein